MSIRILLIKDDGGRLTELVESLNEIQNKEKIVSINHDTFHREEPNNYGGMESILYHHYIIFTNENKEANLGL